MCSWRPRRVTMSFQKKAYRRQTNNSKQTLRQTPLVALQYMRRRNRENKPILTTRWRKAWRKKINQLKSRIRRQIRNWRKKSQRRSKVKKLLKNKTKMMEMMYKFSVTPSKISMLPLVWAIRLISLWAIYTFNNQKMSTIISSRMRMTMR